MKNILAVSNRRVLEEFAATGALLAFDFDGTLAPIVEIPERARMRPATRRLLAELASLYPCVVISGRSRRDVLARLDGVPLRGVIGNHGVEPWEAVERFKRQVRRWHPLLKERLRRLPGVRIEDKAYSISVHYRQSRRKGLARARILEAAMALGDVRVLGGARVVNILPAAAPHKGMAFARERERLGCDTALYVGDDDTDEDVFSRSRSTRLLTVRVGAKADSAASYFIRRQGDIDALLRLLAELRSPPREAARKKGPLEGLPTGSHARMPRTRIGKTR